MDLADQMTLKLPAAFDGFLVNVWNYTDKKLRGVQHEARWDQQRKKWIIDIFLLEVDYHLKPLKPA